MREVDVPHETKNQREARCDKEIERAERDPAKNRVQEHALTTKDFFHFVGPRREHQPEKYGHGKRDDKRPNRIALNEALHTSRPKAP